MAWKPEFIFLITVSTAVDFIIAKKIYKTSKKKKRKLLLSAGIIFNLSLLAAFKYLNFFSQSIKDTFDLFNIFINVPIFNILLPVGISFYTFQTISYSIDVYRKNIKPENNFITFALFVSFFPQLVAGPIERAGKLIPQLSLNAKFEYKRISSGLKLMFWGFFKKIVIADNISNYVDSVFSHSEYFKGLTIIVAMIFFTFQIYCDFSGYSDIAIGASRIMGVNLSLNFRHPFISKSIREFWRNWHITLHKIINLYLYRPLFNIPKLKTHTYFIILITFIFSGLWHGANFTFIVWGMYSAIMLILEYILLKKIKNKNLENNKKIISIRVLYTFVSVVFGFMIFRADSMAEFYTLFINIFNTDYQIANVWFIGKIKFVIIIILISLVTYVQIIETKHDFIEFISRKTIFVRYFIYYISLLVFILYGNFGLEEFMYFRF